MEMYGRSRTFAYLALSALVLTACALQPTSAVAQMTSVGIDCSQIQALGLMKQENFRAGKALIECGVSQGGHAEKFAALPLTAPNVQVSNRTCTSASTCTKSENMVFANTSNPLNIVVNYNDNNGGSNYSGTSYSNDGGVTFTEIQPAPFTNGHGENFGDPLVVYNAKLGAFYAGDLATGCGGQGIGLWTSTDGVTWTTGACAHTGSGTFDDRPSMWVDNEPTSGTYGRMYVSWNNFDIGSGALSVTHSDDGVTWSTPVLVSNTTTFVRDVQITGSPAGATRYEGNDSTVFIAGMDEGGGGCATRQNLIFKSLDGGVTWTKITIGGRFAPICDALCSSNTYFAQVNPIIRHMGWGEPGVGPNGVVHYVFAGLGINGDPGDIYYVRSTNNGVTWSSPLRLSGADAAFKEQWMPSLSVDAAGGMVISWYDRFHSTTACTKVGDAGCNYARVGRTSTNNGVSFSAETLFSPLIPQPAQPDGAVVSCYAGDYDYDTTLGGNAFITWTDGRRVVGGQHVQDVEFASVPIP
jgi:hypothetical protein